MNIVCIICSDLLVPSDDVFYTPCGHIFHFVCLTQWLERSKSCPQCREKATSHKIHRIYFNFSNNDSLKEDTCSLQDKIDKLNFQLLLASKDVKQYSQKCETLDKQTAELRKEVFKVESELNKKNNIIYAFKEQIKYLKEQNLETETMKQEIEQLRKKIDNYKNIQTLLEASTEDTDEVISRTCDPNTLITYISVMKREMLISLNKRRDLRSKIKSLQQELTTVSLERKFLSEEYTKRKKLEEDLLICESEKMFLENKLKDRERNIPLVKKTSSFTSETAGKLNSNLNTASKQAEIGRIAINSTELEKWDIPVKEKDRSIASVVQKNEKDSPYLQVKSGGAILKQYSNQKRVMKTNSSILTKRSRMEEPSKTNGQVKTNMITYNGFGGHSKLNHFPSTCGMKVRGIKDGHE
ncbi:TRAF interacting protein no poles isoform X1 [Andrena cerasifolii]|uniref:TRAF interacting protein no poles isoform X1 n=1 Tax=Andrena cerasifolii TaxID=2819439 RepID=UPI004037CE60